jgi:hypothetical protein
LRGAKARDRYLVRVEGHLAGTHTVDTASG